MHLNTADRVLNWIAGLAVVALIAIILFTGANSNKNTTSNTPPADKGSASAPMKPSSTTAPIKPPHRALRRRGIPFGTKNA